MCMLARNVCSKYYNGSGVNQRIYMKDYQVQNMQLLFFLHLCMRAFFIDKHQTFYQWNKRTIDNVWIWWVSVMNLFTEIENLHASSNFANFAVGHNWQFKGPLIMTCSQIRECKVWNVGCAVTKKINKLFDILCSSEFFGAPPLLCPVWHFPSWKIQRFQCII